MTRLLLASGNPGKLAELRRLVEGSGIEVVGPAEVPIGEPAVEDGATFAENAVAKAVAAATFSGLPVLADDSGLAVDVLNGMPGVRSARWSGPDATDEANVALLLRQLFDVPDEARGARFVCAVALAVPDGSGAKVAEVATGELRGSITRTPAGAGGFGYDPVFRPLGQDTTAAELTPAAKDAISHRGRALRAMLDYLAAHPSVLRAY